MYFGKPLSFWFYFLSTLLLSGMFAFFDLTEYYTVAVLEKTGAYPFGGEGTNSWLYKSKEIYASVNLIFGLLYATAFAFTVWAYVQNKKKSVILIFMSLIFLIIFQTIISYSPN